MKFKRKEGNSSCTLEDGEMIDGETHTFIEYLWHCATLFLI